MIQLTIEFDCPDPEARVERNGLGEVTPDGKYRRTEEIPERIYPMFLEQVEADEEATIKKVNR